MNYDEDENETIMTWKAKGQVGETNEKEKPNNEFFVVWKI